MKRTNERRVELSDEMRDINLRSKEEKSTGQEGNSEEIKVRRENMGKREKI